MLKRKLYIIAILMKSISHISRHKKVDYIVWTDVKVKEKRADGYLVFKAYWRGNTSIIIIISEIIK